MSYESEEKAIFSYVQTKWDTVVFFPVAYENNPFNIPETCYSEISIINFGSQQKSLGGRGTPAVFRKFGYVQFDIFDVINEGKRNTSRTVGEFCRLFQALELSTEDGETVNFFTPDVRTLGVKNSRYRTLIRCQFYRDELTPPATQ